MTNDSPVFGEVLVPVLTPFTTDLEVDEQRLVSFCSWLLDQGASGLAVFGTTGEANSLSTSERTSLLEALLDGGIPAERLLPGTGACALPDAVRLTRHAVARGCGGVLALPPFYYKGVGEEGLYASYAELIERVADVRLKLYLYHIPQMSGVAISLSLIERLVHDYPHNVVGVKDSSGDWNNTIAMLDKFPDLAIYPSSESRLMEALQLGATGCISATGNINVAAITRLAAEQPGSSEANRQQAEVGALRRAVEHFELIPALKAIMAHYTDDPGWFTVRPPLAPLESGAHKTLLSSLQTLDFGLSYRWNKD